jgi:hypothetical protein
MFYPAQIAAIPDRRIGIAARKLFGLRHRKDCGVGVLITLSFTGLALSLFAAACSPSLVATIAAYP